MKQGQYITDRFLPTLVAQAAANQSIAHTSMSDDWVIRLEKNGAIRWVLGYQFDVNTAAASALAQDKVATHLLLKAANLPSITHVLVRTVPHQEPSRQLLLEHFGDRSFVIKPLDGSGGHGVKKVRTIDTAVSTILESGEIAWAASPYHQLTNEYRVIVLNDQPLITYEKTQPVHLHGMDFYNLGLGAVAMDIADETLLHELTSLARDACSAASLRLASVDIVRLEDGSLQILEINDGIMMENYARQSEEYKKRAANTYDAIVRAMFA